MSKAPITTPKMLMLQAKDRCAEMGQDGVVDINKMVRCIEEKNVDELRCYLRVVCMRTSPDRNDG